MDSTILQPPRDYPDDWLRIDFDHFATLQRGKDLTRDQFRNGEIPVAGSNGIIGYHDAANAKAPGITVGRSGSVGKVTLYRQDFWAHNTALFVKDFHGNAPEFIAFFLDFLRLGRFGSGASVPTLDRNVFRTLPIVIPPPCEQRKIAAVLGLAQRAIEQQERLISLTTELKKALLHKLFTEGLRGEPQKQTEIGPMPESWEIKRFGDLAMFKNGINFTSGQKGDRGILTVDVLNMYGDGCTILLDKIYRVDKEVREDYLLKDGDILFVRSSVKLEGVGWTCLFRPINEPVTYCGFIIRARLLDPTATISKFVTHYFRTERARRTLVSGGAKVAITNINQGLLQGMLLPIPSVNEQIEIADAVDQIDRKIALYKAKSALLSDLFRTLLHQLMTAQIRVHRLELPAEET